MAAISLEHESTALDPLIEHFFAVINPATVRSSVCSCNVDQCGIRYLPCKQEIIPKLAPAGIVGPEAVKIGQEANGLFTDALGTLSPFVTAYLKLFPPTAPPSQGVACDDPKITRSTISRVYSLQLYTPNSTSPQSSPASRLNQ